MTTKNITFFVLPIYMGLIGCATPPNKSKDLKDIFVLIRSNKPQAAQEAKF